MKLTDERTVLWAALLVLTIAAYWPVFSSGRLPGGDMSDTVAQGYPFFQYTAQRLSGGELPLWNPYILCGTPFYESFSAPVFYPLRGLPMLIFGPSATIRFLFPVHMLLAGLFAWLLLKAMKVSRWGALVGSAAYAMGAWANTLFYAGHGSKVICWAWFPLILYAALKFTGTRKPRYVGLGALAVGMQGLSSHPQMMLYSAGSAFVLVLFQTRKPLARSLGINLGGLAGILLLGGAVAAVQLYPGYLFSQHTARGSDLSLETAASYSLPPEETIAMVLPGMFGLRHGFPGSTVSGIPVYFGRLGLRLSSEFVGVAFFILGIAGLAGAKERRTRNALISLTVLGALVSWGGYTPVFGVLYRLLPVFRKLRAPHMAAFVTTSALALAAGSGFDALFSRGKAGNSWKVIAGVSALGLILFLAAGPVSGWLQASWWSRMGVADPSPYPAVIGARSSLLAEDFLRLSAVAAVVALLLFLSSRGKTAAATASVVILVLSAVELVPFNRSFQVYLRYTSVEALFPDAPQLRDLTGDGRVFPGGNSLIPLGIRSVTGYHAAKTLEMEGLLGSLSSGSPWILRQTCMTAYLEGQTAAGWEQLQPVLAQEAAGFPEDPMPRAFIPESTVPGSGEAGFEELAMDLNPQTRSVIDLSGAVTEGVSGTAWIIEDLPEKVTISTSSSSAGFLVLADTWYPRWLATVDGIPVEVSRANGWMRAVEIPAGEHTVVFTYDDSHVKRGFTVSIAALAVSLALCFLRTRKTANA